jgi:hypothetical protein
MATETVWVIYSLSAEDRAKIEADGGELPTPTEIWVGSLDQQKALGFVECDPDGTPIKAVKAKKED